MPGIIKYAYATFKRRRKMNEDNLSVDGHYLPKYHDDCSASAVILQENESHSFCVFDGMGGEQEGEAASWIAAKKYSEMISETEDMSHASYHTDMIPRTWKFSDRIATVCRSINQDICAYGLEQKYGTIGTTMAGITVTDDRLYGYHIGDSRIYHLKNGCLEQCTKDHVPNPIFSCMKGLTQYLGIPESDFIVCPDIFEEAIQSGDKYLICSDGFSDGYSIDEMSRFLQTGSPEDAMGAIVNDLEKKEEKDNVTVILLYF